jgi:hypothetical protein
LGYVLHHLVGLLEGQELADHDRSREDFDEAANVIVDLVPAEGIVEEATGHLEPSAAANIKVEPYWPVPFYLAPRMSMPRPP